ncbi:MAG: hypothetical protein QMD46_07975 [Methanomicrobiales archaeon]|nr:hypothetical protein [Methanomicrobiales archaeon]MDI6877329.1 hypothetical protein [Methanomicrobiales archaeon]
MQQRSRRCILLVTVVAAGSVLVFLDAPLPILISAAFLTGFMVMILTGSLRPGGRTEKKGQESPRMTPPPPKGEAVPGKKRTALRLPFSGFIAALRAGVARFQTRGNDPEVRMRKIDELLDEALADSPASPRAPPALQKPAAPGGGSAADPADPFLALSSAQLEDGLLMDSAEESGYEMDDLQGLDASLLGEETPVRVDQETDDVDEILMAHENGLAGLDDLDGMDAIASQFEDLADADLDAVDPGLPDGTAPVRTPPPPQPPAPPKVDANPTGEAPGEDMLAFASGSTGDELLSALRADIAPMRRGLDLSLVRDLKDTKVDARDLERELEETLGKLRSLRT